jgi:hypothetical protein
MSTHPFDTSTFAHTKFHNVPSYLQGEWHHHNLKAAEKFDNYATIAASVDDAMAALAQIDDARARERWQADEGGWYSPNGFSESDWEHELGFPLPEHEDWFDWQAQRRIELNWRMDDTGWYSPNGRHESEFDADQLPEYQTPEISDDD